MPSYPPWTHILGTDPRASILLAEAGIDSEAISAMLAIETRPRRARFEQGDVIIMRGVNLSDGALLEDMVSVRVWVTDGALITVSMRELDTLTIEYERQSRSEPGMPSPDRFLALLDAITDDLKEALRETEEELEATEERVLERFDLKASDQLRSLRRRAITLRRFLHPQLQALLDLQRDARAWLNRPRSHQLRELINTTERVLEGLSATRDHIGAVQDQLDTWLAEKTRRTNQALAVVATIFLPLNLFAALLGMNVGGIPLAGHTSGFLIVIGIFAIALIPALIAIWLVWRR